MRNLLAHKVAEFAQRSRLSSFPLVKRFGYVAMYKWSNREYKLVKTNLGFEMLVDPYSPVGKSVIRYGFWEENTSKLVYQTLHPGMTFVDVGANFGYYTLLAATKLDNKGRIIAFEPDPKNFEILQKNVKLNKLAQSVTYENYGIADQPKKTATLHRSPFDPGASSLFVNEYTSKIEVKLDSLDNYCISHNINPDLIKMDIEGAEYLALEGMRSILSSQNPPSVIMEYNSDFLRLHDECKKIKERILGLQRDGFCFYKICKEGKLEKCDARIILEWRGPNNILFKR
jgi:FkbM family methyltransferase